MSKRMTKNEKYLLSMIAYLRGNAWTGQGLARILLSKEKTQFRPTKKQAKEELETLDWELRERFGKGLPHPSDPLISDTKKHKMIVRSRNQWEKDWPND